MPTASRPTGVTIVTPESYRIAGGNDAALSASSTEETRRDIARAAGDSTRGSDAPLLASLRAQAFDVVDRIELLPRAATRSGGRAAQRPDIQSIQQIELQIDVVPNTDPVLLVQQGGAYVWFQGAAARPTGASDRPAVRFTVEIHPTAAAAPPGAGAAASPLIYERLTVYVLRFRKRLESRTATARSDEDAAAATAARPPVSERPYGEPPASRPPAAAPAGPGEILRRGLRYLRRGAREREAGAEPAPPAPPVPTPAPRAAPPSRAGSPAPPLPVPRSTGRSRSAGTIPRPDAAAPRSAGPVRRSMRHAEPAPAGAAPETAAPPQASPEPRTARHGAPGDGASEGSASEDYAFGDGAFEGSAPEMAPPKMAPPDDAESVPAPAAAAPAIQRIECHVLAEMDPQVRLGDTATIEVSLSREQLVALEGRAAAASGGVQVDATSRLLVQVMPRVNFSLAPGTKDRVEVDPPAAGSPVILYFDVVAKHAGAGEVWVIVRQNQMGVARLVLKPAIVEDQPSPSAPRVEVRAEASAAPPLARPLDQLNIFEQTIGDTVHYLFELEMPSHNVFGLHASPPLDVKRDEYVARLYKEIEERYVSTYDHAAKKADVAAFTAELQAYGAVLFDRLFPREIQALLWTHRDAIRSVRVVSTEPFIPWEIVHLREPGQPVDPSAPTRFLGQMGLVRWLHNVNGLPPTGLRVREGRARYVIPDYADPRLKLPSTLNERLYLEKTFAATAIEPQPNPLRAALTEPGHFDMIHFACHGEADPNAITYARIVLQGRDEGEFVQTYMNASTVETFAQLRGPDGVQPLVFLNACQAGRAGYQLTGIGGFAQAFLRAGAGAFVGTLWSVDDQPAFFFGKAFYESLRTGATVAEAAIAAREAARQDDATWLAYVVYAHPHATLTVG